MNEEVVTEPAPLADFQHRAWIVEFARQMRGMAGRDFTGRAALLRSESLRFAAERSGACLEDLDALASDLDIRAAAGGGTA